MLLKHKPELHDRERSFEKLRSLAPISLTWFDLTNELGSPYAYSSELLAEIEIFLDIPGMPMPKQGRQVGVARAAQALAQHLNDAGARSYRYLVRQLLRLNQQGRVYFQTVCTMVLRVKADIKEGSARKPRALLVSRLRNLPYETRSGGVAHLGRSLIG